MPAKHLLVVTADRALRVEALGALDLAATLLSAADDVASAADVLASATPDLIVLDGRSDHEGAVEFAREHGGASVVIVVSEAGEGHFKDLLLAGARDVVAAESLHELGERAAGRLRRENLRPASSPDLAPLDLGRLRLDYSVQRAWLDGTELGLSAKELLLLYVLAQNVGTLVARDTIFAFVWGDGVPGDSKTLDVHISRLRKRLAAVVADGASLVKSLRGSGYLLSSEVVTTVAAAAK